MSSEKKRISISINSYQSIWNYRRLVYTIMGKKVPTPIPIRDAVYFLVIALVNLLVNLVFRIPNFGILGIAIKYFMFPYVLMKMLKYFNLDGKSPFAFVRDYISYFFKRNKEYEFCREVVSSPQEYILDWKCSYRHTLKLRRNANVKT